MLKLKSSQLLFTVQQDYVTWKWRPWFLSVPAR